LNRIKKYLLLTKLLVLITGIAFSQSKSIDSLSQIIKTAKDDTAKVSKYVELGNLYEEDENDKNALQQYTQGLQLSEKLNYKKGIAISLYEIGGIYYDESSYAKSFEQYNRALQINTELNDSTRMGDCLNMIGDVYRKQAKYPKALESLLKSLTIREKLNQVKRISATNNNIGLVYLELNSYKKALEYFEKALATAKETNNKFTICRCYNRMAIVYNELGQNSKAMGYYQLALQTAKEVDDKTIMWIVYGNIGSLYTELKEYDNAIAAYQEAIKLASFLGNKEGLCSTYSNMAFLDLKQKKYKPAEELFLKAEQLGIELNLNDNLMEIYAGLSRLKKETGQFEKALEYHVLFKNLTDSIYNADNTKQLSDLKTQFEVDKKENEIKAQAAAHKVIADEEKKRHQLMTYTFIAILIIVLLFSLFLYNRFRLTNKQKNIIEHQKHQVEHQKELVEEKQKEILDSIAYAKRLQEAILPSLEFIDLYIPENFVFYKPKDIVAGDFYWAEKVDDLFFIAAADCTGHGVPGAMVSVVCSNALNRSVKEFHLTITGEILDKTRELVLETFEKSSSDVKDGMDISLLCIDRTNKKIFWSGANNPLWYVTSDASTLREPQGSAADVKEMLADPAAAGLEATISTIKPNKQSIGKTENAVAFTTHEIEYKEGLQFYLFTDGFADQFGGEKGKKFKYKQLSQLLFSKHHLPLSEQSKFLDDEFTKWKGNLEQVDDVCIIGIKI